METHDTERSLGFISSLDRKDCDAKPPNAAELQPVKPAGTVKRLLSLDYKDETKENIPDNMASAS